MGVHIHMHLAHAGICCVYASDNHFEELVLAFHLAEARSVLLFLLLEHTPG